MILPEMLDNLRIELQDVSQQIYSEGELTRAIEKSVALMSRLIPDKSLAETTIGTVPSDAKQELNISSFLPDFIRIERIEYPKGNIPITYPPFELIGSTLFLKGENVFTKDKKLRIIYFKRWTAPTADTAGDYPSHLDNAVIIGSAGQALIFKAEKYVQEAAKVLVELEAPNLPAPPTAPTAPTLSFTNVEYALTKVASGTPETGVVKEAKDDLASGREVINAATRGEAVATGYGNYAGVEGTLAGAYITQASTYLREEEAKLTKYASEVTSYGSEVNKYANTISGLVSKYTAQASEQEVKAGRFLEIAGRYLASGQSKINEFLVMLGVKVELQPVMVSSRQPIS